MHKGRSKSLTPRTILKMPLEVALSVGLGLATGVGGAAATTYTVAYSIRDRALSDMREVVREAVNQEGRARAEALSHKVDRAELVQLLATEAARRTEQHHELLVKLREIEVLVRRKLGQ